MTLHWKPDKNRVAQANLSRFMKSHGHATYESLYRWSIERPAEFWPAMWEFAELKASTPWNRVVDDLQRMPGARWFEGARLNFAENLLRFRDQRIALSFENERGESRELTYAALYEEVAAVAAGLRAAGVKVGDRVAAFLPNIPEAVVAMLATASIGAIWSSSSPDFGEKGVLDRFGQIEPTVLFAVKGYTYAGKPVDCQSRIDNIVRALPSLKRTVFVPYAGHAGDYDQLKQAGQPLRFEQLPFDHPLYIMYSSGTTGVPKCIVHGTGGTLLQHAKELLLHTDLKREDRIFYFTTCGWMMWNWLVSSLLGGATVMLYDGSPTHPAPDALWQWAERAKISIFGTSAKYLSAIEKAGVVPRSRNLSALRTILSTGSPLLPESYDYVYRDIRADVCLSSISGGTDIISCFALGNPILPVYRAELQCRGLGMKVEVWDDDGKSVRGQKGELCCTMAFPSMPVSFWNDPDGRRYRQSYFEKFPGIWCHGDYALLTEHDGMIIYGRSDATLNPGGVRIGTAEIYRVVEQIPDVLESMAVGHERDGDVEVILFVVLSAGKNLDHVLENRIRAALRSEASPRHVPARIFQVPAIPRTISGKITELAVQKILRGEEVKNKDALANPEALDAFKAIAGALFVLLVVLSGCLSATTQPPMQVPDPDPNERQLSSAQQRLAGETIWTFRSFQSCAVTYKENDIAFTTKCASMFAGRKVLLELSDLSGAGRAFEISGGPLENEGTLVCTLEFSDDDEARAQEELDLLANLKRRDLVILEVGTVKTYDPDSQTLRFSACKFLGSD